MSTSELHASAHPGNTGGVTATLLTRECRNDKCEINIHVGVFFNGTGSRQNGVARPAKHGESVA